MAKLTLSVDDRVIAGAKRYARKKGVSVSRMVETYLASVVEPTVTLSHRTPIYDSLRGILKRADAGDYRRYIQRKYR